MAAFPVGAWPRLPVALLDELCRGRRDDDLCTKASLPGPGERRRTPWARFPSEARAWLLGPVLGVPVYAFSLHTHKSTRSHHTDFYCSSSVTKLDILQPNQQGNISTLSPS